MTQVHMLSQNQTQTSSLVKRSARGSVAIFEYIKPVHGGYRVSPTEISNRLQNGLRRFDGFVEMET